MATDTHDIEFVVAVEAKDYPIAGVMFHPETQNIRVFPGGDNSALRGKVNTDTTDKLNFYFSDYLRRQAAKSLRSHKFEDPEFGKRMLFLNTPVGLTKMYSSLVLTYGLN